MVCLSGKKETAASLFKRSGDFAVLLLIAALTGVVCGAVGGAFAKSVGIADSLRAEYPWLIYFLPFGGLVSAALYRFTKTEGIGIKTVFECIRGKAEIPLLLLPVIYGATLITHLFGGSAGKEGAALQLGSGVAEQASKITKSAPERKAVLTVCGMAAVFSAVFGTPAGACFFALEVAFGGYINAAAVFPVFVSSIAAFAVSDALGVKPESFHLGALPDFSVAVLFKTAAVAAVASAAAYVFCHMLHGGEKLFERAVKNPFLRIFAGGCVIVILTLIFGTDYNGGGIFVIERIFEGGAVRPEAFLLKIIFTVITVSAGYKGGEIVPSFFIGATLGAILSPILGLPAEFCAAVGMTAFFGGVSNCPIAAAVIGVELFGANGFWLSAAAALASKVFSGRVSLYNKQKFLSESFWLKKRIMGERGVKI